MFSERPFYRDGDVVTKNGRLGWVDKETADKRVGEMNEALLQWYNELVKPGDTVWHLGDFCFGKNGNAKARVEYFVKRLNGQCNWVFGNHDGRDSRKAEGFNVKTHYHELRNIGPDKHMFVLMHYAMRTWNRRHYGAIQLYGHSHGNLPEETTALSYDIGVDCHKYRPVHIDDVIAYMMAKKQDIDTAGMSWRGKDNHTE